LTENAQLQAASHVSQGENWANQWLGNVIMLLRCLSENGTQAACRQLSTSSAKLPIEQVHDRRWQILQAVYLYDQILLHVESTVPHTRLELIGLLQPKLCVLQRGTRGKDTECCLLLQDNDAALASIPADDPCYSNFAACS
jgi:hypothetical protein